MFSGGIEMEYWHGMSSGKTRLSFKTYHFKKVKVTE